MKLEPQYVTIRSFIHRLPSVNVSQLELLLETQDELFLLFSQHFVFSE